jgi:hypothetical protein
MVYTETMSVDGDEPTADSAEGGNKLFYERKLQ